MVNSIDPNQMASSDLDLHCLKGVTNPVAARQRLKPGLVNLSIFQTGLFSILRIFQFFQIGFLLFFFNFKDMWFHFIF